MDNIIVEKFFGFRECERCLEDKAKQGWVLCGFTWCCSFKDIFVVTFKKGEPENVRFRIDKYVEKNLSVIEQALNKNYDNNWELVSSSWTVSTVVLKSWDILVVVHKQYL